MTVNGESNPNATLTDYDVELIRELWDSEAGMRLAEGGKRRPASSKRIWTYDRLAETFGVSRRTISSIVRYRSRCAN